METKNTNTNANVVKNPLVILLVIAALAIGYLFSRVQALEQGTAGSPTVANDGSAAAEAPAGDVDPITAEDHIKGNADTAKAILIEYSDTECPFCQQFHPTVQRLTEEYGDDFAWSYRHFPLTNIHSKAPKEAEATECAAELAGNDGFWAMLDKIFEVTPANNGLDLDILPELAEEVGLDRAAFVECLDSGKYADKVDAFRQSGVKAGVNGTPGSFLVNVETGETQTISGALPYEQLKSQIDQILGK